jgi:hypothetical protein
VDDARAALSELRGLIENPSFVKRVSATARQSIEKAITVIEPLAA